MIEFRSLTSVTPDVFPLLSAGYSTMERYVVTKMETRERTVFSLDLETLTEPYVKRFELNDGDLTHYHEVVEQGFSLGAWEGSRLVGVAIAEWWRWNNCLWIWEFHVAPDRQGQGIGRAMADELLNRARLAGVSMVGGETQNTNVPAISAYRKFGAEIAGLDLSYYGDNLAARGEIAVFVRRKI